MRRDTAGASLARLAGVLTLVLTGMIGSWVNPEALFIVLLPAAAGVLALTKASSSGAVGASAVMLLLGATPLIFGGIGFLYLPLVGMLIAAAFLTERAEARRPADAPAGP